MQHDLIIVGTGIAGLSLAFELYERGLRPLMISARSSMLPPASFAAQGVLCNKGLRTPIQALFTAKIESSLRIRQWLQRISKRTGQTIDHAFEGIYEPYWDAGRYQKIVQRVYKGQYTGLFGCRNIKGTNLEWPDFKTPAGALYYPEDGWFDPRSLLTALKVYLESKLTWLQADLQSIQLDPHHGYRLRFEGHPTVHGRRLCLAMGAGLPAALSSLELRLPDFFFHPGTVLQLPYPRTNDSLALVSGTYSLTHRRQGLFLGSTTDKCRFDQLYEYPLDDGKQQLIEFLRQQLHYIGPGPQRLQSFIEQASSLWGVRLRSKDRMPVFGSLGSITGEAKHAGIYLLGAFYKNGLQLAERLAAALADEICGKAVDNLSMHFHAQRWRPHP